MHTFDLFLIDYGINLVAPHWWKDIASIFLIPGRKFILSCWEDEKALIDHALTYGNLMEKSPEVWTVEIEGRVTSALREEILQNQSIPSEDHYDHNCIYHGLRIEDAFCSAHYGTEIYLTDLDEETFLKVKAILSPIREYFTDDLKVIFE